MKLYPLYGVLLFRNAVQNIIQYFSKKSENKYEEEMRREDMMEAAKRLIPAISLGIIGLLFVVGGYSYWTYKKDVELFRGELLYDDYLEDIRHERFEAAQIKKAQLKKLKQMKGLLEIETCVLKTLAFTREKTIKKREKLWNSMYDGYTALDFHLFKRNRAQSSMYHFTRFILAIFANEISLKNSRIPDVKHYLQGSNSFLGLAYSLYALDHLRKGTLKPDLVDRWEICSQSWIPTACAIGAGISRATTSLKP